MENTQEKKFTILDALIITAHLLKQRAISIEQGAEVIENLVQFIQERDIIE